MIRVRRPARRGNDFRPEGPTLRPFIVLGPDPPIGESQRGGEVGTIGHPDRDPRPLAGVTSGRRVGERDRLSFASLRARCCTGVPEPRGSPAAHQSSPVPDLPARPPPLRRDPPGSRRAFRPSSRREEPNNQGESVETHAESTALWSPARGPVPDGHHPSSPMSSSLHPTGTIPFNCVPRAVPGYTDGTARRATWARG